VALPIRTGPKGQEAPQFGSPWWSGERTFGGAPALPHCMESGSFGPSPDGQTDRIDERERLRL